MAGIHVDDTVTGGSGAAYHASIAALRKALPFRKWLTGGGEFRGPWREQSEESRDIRVSQEKFAQGMKRAAIRPRGDASVVANDKEISAARSMLGSGSWLAKETRPDLACQVSFGQQMFPKPTLGDIRQANNLVRRAHQFSDVAITYPSSPFGSLRLICHSDASQQNAARFGAQGGYIVGATEANLRRVRRPDRAHSRGGVIG